MFIGVGLRMNADPPQRIEIHFHHMAAVILNRRIEGGEGFHPAAARQPTAFIGLKADGNARFQASRQTRAMPVFGEVDQHVILTRLQSIQ